MWTHHNGMNQRWVINYKTVRPVYKSTGIKPNAPFMIKSNMPGGKVLYYWNHIGGSQHTVRIRKPQYDYREIWFYDSNSGHIRNYRYKNYVLAVEKGKSGHRGARLVMRINGHGKDEAWNYQAGKYHNWSPLSNNFALDVAGGKNVDGQPVILWSPHNGPNQRFEVSYSVTRPVYKSTNLKPGQPFFIRSVMGGNRVLFFDNGIAGNQYQIKLRTPKYDEREIWVFDPNTGHIRNNKHRAWALGVQNGNNNRGAKLVLRLAVKDPSVKWNYSPKGYHNWTPFSNKGLAIDVAHGRNADGAWLHMWTHHNG